MSRVIEVEKCSQCPLNRAGRNGRHFCMKWSENGREILKKDFPGEDQYPAWCPLRDKDDYLESEFNPNKHQV